MKKSREQILTIVRREKSYAAESHRDCNLRNSETARGHNIIPFHSLAREVDYSGANPPAA